jgi:hypothetical protein
MSEKDKKSSKSTPASSTPKRDVKSGEITAKRGQTKLRSITASAASGRMTKNSGVDRPADRPLAKKKKK